MHILIHLFTSIHLRSSNLMDRSRTTANWLHGRARLGLRAFTAPEVRPAAALPARSLCRPSPHRTGRRRARNGRVPNSLLGIWGCRTSPPASPGSSGSLHRCRSRCQSTIPGRAAARNACPPSRDCTGTGPSRRSHSFRAPRPCRCERRSRCGQRSSSWPSHSRRPCSRHRTRIAPQEGG